MSTAARNNRIHLAVIELSNAKRRLADERASCASQQDIAFWESEVVVRERVLARLRRNRY